MEKELETWYQCDRCTACCKWPGDVRIEPEEIDQIASFLFIGRPIEIKNSCASSVSVYLETDTPDPTPPEGETFMTIAPGTTKALSTKSKSKFVHLYGQSVPYEGRQWFWRSNDRDLRRSVETKTIHMRPVTMTTKARAAGSFMIELICP